MARYSADIIWLNHFGSASRVPCPICRTIIYSDKNTNQNIPGGWQISHIISDARGGVSTLINLVPLCLKCNRGMSSDNYYTFLAKKGIISYEQADAYNEEQKKINHQFESICQAPNCGNKKYLVFGELCSKHASKDVTPMLIDPPISSCRLYPQTTGGPFNVCDYSYWTQHVIDYYPFKMIPIPENIQIH